MTNRHNNRFSTRVFGYGTENMAQRETDVLDINTRPAKGDKSTQRERLIAGMIAAACRDGYSGVTVSTVIAHAGVSRPTFYDYFTDKDDCFLATHRDISERLMKHIQVAVDQAPPEQAPQAAIRRLLERAEEEPARAQFIANEAMAGGPRALDARDHTISEIERIIEAARVDAATSAPTPDLPTRSIIGAAHWLLSQRLRRGEHDLSSLADELEGWIESYNQPAHERRWWALTPEPSPEPSPHVSELPTRPPPPIPSGRTRLSSSEIAQNQRWRILFATAETAALKGYTAATVTDIAALARVDKRVFYTHFRDKQQAFLAAHELAFQQTMAVAASGFFSAEKWPERVWQGIHAASQFIATHPIAYLVHVESHAVGAPAIQRVDDSHTAFTIFLHDGNQHAAEPQSRTAMEAIIAATFEIGYQQFRKRTEARELPRFAYHATYLCLAPFLGPEAANAFIDGKQGD
jgi:AcrR family transcriptional regulator